MSLKREMNNKKPKKMTSKVSPSKKTQTSTPFVDLEWPLSESITQLVHREVIRVLNSPDLLGDHAKDFNVVRMKDLKKLIDHLTSRTTFQTALRSNAKVFAEAILNVKKCSFKLEARLWELEQLVHKGHNHHIKQVVRDVMKECGYELASEFHKRETQPMTNSERPPAKVLFKRPADSGDIRGAVKVDKSQPTKLPKPIKLSEGKKSNYYKLTKEHDRLFPVISKKDGRLSASDSAIVAPNVSKASHSATLIARMKKQHMKRLAEKRVHEANALSTKKSPFSTYLNDVEETFPVSLRQTCVTEPVKDKQTIEHQPHYELKYKIYHKHK